MSAYIYAIENIITHNKYIGQTKNPKKRKCSHFSKLRNNKHINKHLQSAFNLYGEKNFEFKILIQCEENEANWLEEKLINKWGYYNSDKRVGYYNNTEEMNKIRSNSHKGIISANRKLNKEQIFEILSIIEFTENSIDAIKKFWGISDVPIRSLKKRKTYCELTSEFDALNFEEKMNIFKETIYKFKFNPFLCKSGTHCINTWNMWRVYKERTNLSYSKMSSIFYRSKDMLQKGVTQINEKSSFSDDELWIIVNTIINNNTVLSLENQEKCND